MKGSHIHNTTAQRINIIGTSASGKSTFGKQLANALDAPFIQMDQLYWGSNWTEPSDEVFFEKLKTSLVGDSWILDGNYTRTIPIKWKRVQTVIWLDYSKTRTFTQSFRRAFKRAWTQEELWPGTGNRESFRKSFFSRDSIILWCLRTYSQTKAKYQEMIKSPQYAQIHFVRLRSPQETTRYLNAVATPK